MGLPSIFGWGKGSIKKALRKGAIIVDVRSGIEYDRGHVPDAFNIPVDRIKASAQRLKESGMPVIVCCSGGNRSALAVQQLKAKGLMEVYNGGNWERVLKIMQSL